MSKHPLNVIPSTAPVPKRPASSEKAINSTLERNLPGFIILLRQHKISTLETLNSLLQARTSLEAEAERKRRAGLTEARDFLHKVDLRRHELQSARDKMAEQLYTLQNIVKQRHPQSLPSHFQEQMTTSRRICELKLQSEQLSSEINSIETTSRQKAKEVWVLSSRLEQIRGQCESLAKAMPAKQGAWVTQYLQFSELQKSVEFRDVTIGELEEYLSEESLDRERLIEELRKKGEELEKIKKENLLLQELSRSQTDFY